MILPFSTTFPKGKGTLSGKPTYFVEKIFKSLIPISGDEIDEYYRKCIVYFGSVGTQDFINKISEVEPKIHSIRDDEKGRWIVDRIIDFFIHVRTPKMFRFLPKTPTKSIQSITIKHFTDHSRIFIDSEEYMVFHHGLDDIYEYDNVVKQLAINDGFDSVEDFFQWFSEDLIDKKIIHWTDFKY